MTSDFVELALNCTTAEAFETEVLAALDRHVGCDVAFFAVKGREERPSTRGLERHVVDQAVRGGPVYERELRPVKDAALAGRDVAVDTRVLGESAVRRMRYFREVASLVGGRHSLFALLRFQGHVVGSVMLGRTGCHFSDREVNAVEQVVPILALGRAAFGWPYRVEPLPAPERRLTERLGFASVRARVHTSCGELLVRDRRGFREMVARDGGEELVWTRSALNEGARSGFPYVDLLHLAAVLAPGHGRALFIGCGGGVAVRQFATLYAGLAIDVVEQEPAVLELARRWFGLGALRGVTVHAADGHRFVLDAPRGRYDIAVVDAYDARGIATDLVSPAFFRALSRALAPGGALAFNVIGTLAPGDLPRTVARAAATAFEEVRCVPVLGLEETFAPETLRNIVLIAARPLSRA